MDKISRNC